MILSLLELARRYNLSPLKNVLHVGGHYGEEFDDYRANGVAYQTWIEPQLECFLEMKRRISYHGGVRLFHTALGSSNGYALMHIERDNAGQSSSILAPKLHATQYPTVRFTGERELVTVMRGDDLFAFETFDFLALDVQGYELEVLKGLTLHLGIIRAISAEVNREELYAGCALIDEVDSFLALHGFRQIALEWCGGTWGEAIYVKQR